MGNQKKDDFTNLSNEEKKELEKLLGIDNKPGADKKDNDLALFSFLQEEFHRLNKLQSFVNNKIPLLSKYPQADAIYQQLQTQNTQQKREAIALHLDDSADLHQNIQLYFDQQFRAKETTSKEG